MTKDLALAMKGKDMARGDWVTTDEYMKRVNVSEAEASPRTRVPDGRSPRCILREVDGFRGVYSARARLTLGYRRNLFRSSRLGLRYGEVQYALSVG
jgi:hypothetical protein